MTRWYWVRHGPTHLRAFAGWTDVPADLSDKAALARLARYLPDDAVVVASDLGRASATADALTAGRQRWPDQPDLREFNFGAWEGLDFDAVSARNPELAAAYWDDPGSVCPPGGESWHQVAARVGGVVDNLNREAPPAIVAVAHMGVILTQYALAAGLAPHRAVAQGIDPLSVTELAWGRGGWRVERVNHKP